MKKFTLYIMVLFCFFACTPGQKKKDSEVMVYCASSLTNIVTELAKEFENENDVKIKLNFASSGTLARQIEHGANPSLYISANKKWVSYLNKIGKTIPEYEKQIASNTLVVIAPISSSLDSFTINRSINLANMFAGRLAVGDPKHVPAGDYAMQTIENLGFKDEMENRILPTKDVRSALMVVELGEVELGIVYKTDAFESKKVKILAEIPNALHEPIVYYLSLLNEKNRKAKLFYAYLNSETSKKIWLKNGFQFE